MRLPVRKARTRIAATGAVVTLVALVLFAVIARIAIQRFLLSDLDDELETLSVALGSDLELRGTTSMPHETLRAGVETNTLVYRLAHHAAVLFDGRRVLAATGDLARHARLADLLVLARHDERPFTVREPFTPQARLCRFRVTHLGQQAAGTTLVIFRPIETVTRTLETVDEVLALLVMAGFVASAATLAVAMRRALAPVEQITSFAANVTARDLSQRVTVAAAGEEFRRLADVINELLERLQLSFDAQRRLVSDVAHELKTPAAIIAAEAQELARGRLSSDESAAALETIAGAAAGLAREVDDLLELARGDAATERATERFALDDAIDDALAAAGPLAKERGIALRREGTVGAQVEGDYAGMVRALANLLINAVRYSSPGVEVLLLARGTGDGFAEVDVLDRGPGVPAAERERIFHRFVRLPNARKEHPEGSGLGLAIVDQVVRRHGGVALVLEREGGGSVFRVRTPVQDANASMG
ncbi:MAG: two-component system, OmpR family, sensor kinase [Acidobacteriota bacterium]|nr:two-component system, OmpR family, sensor kinase [Acidobacteriota bacterium]